MKSSIILPSAQALRGMTLVAAGFLLAPQQASATPVEYVRVCDMYGAGYAYIPGTEQCADTKPLGYKVETEAGTLTNLQGSQTTVYGANGFTAGTGSSAFGNGAYAGGDPNAPIPMAPPGDPNYDPTNDPDYAALYATNGGYWPRGTGPGEWPATRYPYSNFQNGGATAVGAGARAGAGAAGQTNATAVGQAASANGANATSVGQGSAANERFAGLENHVNDEIGDAKAGIAAALATSSLIQATTPGRNVITGGVGVWSGETAAAVGISRRFDENWTLKTAGTVTGRTGVGLNAAIGYEF